MRNQELAEIAVGDFMIEIETLLQIPGQNKRERWHWSRQRKEVTGWHTVFRYHAILKLAGLHQCPPNQKRQVTITSYRRQRFHDEANLIGGCKGLIDGLVRSGLIADDSIKLATFNYRQELASRHPSKRACTLIQIEDIL